MSIKDQIKSVLSFFHIDLTKNLEYDRLTRLIFTKIIKKNSNCIDIGCHKGEILDQIVQLAPNGQHFAFEPIPVLFENLVLKYGKKCSILPYALSNENGSSTFNYVKNAPAYSGINKREYAVAHPEIQEIQVELKRLDEIIPEQIKIDLIKIDVEGAEFGVLKGAKNLITQHHPIIIFECGIGASDFYNTKPEELFQFLSDCGLKISKLKSWLKAQPALSKQGFIDTYTGKKEYYFIAHPH